MDLGEFSPFSAPYFQMRFNVKLPSSDGTILPSNLFSILSRSSGPL